MLIRLAVSLQMTDVNSMVHSYLTNRGRAMHLIQDRLVKVMGSNRKNCTESSDVEKV